MSDLCSIEEAAIFVLATALTEAEDDGRWVTIDGAHVFISDKTGTVTKGPAGLLGKYPKGGEPWRKTKEEFIGPSPYNNPELASGAREATKEESDAFMNRLHRETQWETSVKAAISEGVLSKEDAVARGLYKGEADQFTPLPQDLYHVTVAADKVDAEGLKTRAEQNVDEGAGLGGGEGNTISFTTDQKIADAIATGIREGRAAARGELTPQEMMRQAESGQGAARPWAAELNRYAQGEYGGYDNLLRGVTLQSGMPKSVDEMPGWKPPQTVSIGLAGMPKNATSLGNVR